MSSKPTPGPLCQHKRNPRSVITPYKGQDSARRFTPDIIARFTNEADAALFVETARVRWETNLTPQQLRERMERAEKQRDELLTALKAIVAIEAVPFDFPADWDAQIAGCSECQRYKDHPIQKGICDNHRKPLYARKRHEDDQQATLIYRAKDAARAAIASVEAAS